MYKEKYGFELYKGQKIGKIQCQDLDTVIYFLDIRNLEIDEEKLKAAIPGNRFQKMLKYRRRVDKQLLVGNELLFEYGMKQIFPDMSYKDIQRDVDQAGKPYLKDIGDLYFNMSHAGNFSVCAFSGKPVGVDVERIELLDLSIAESYFTLGEYGDIIGMDTEEKQINRFFDYWVLKESFMKSIGFGLSIQLNAFRFTADSNGLLRVVQSINDRHYKSRQLYFGKNYKLAVCRETSE